jgi:hypothetical protein
MVLSSEFGGPAMTHYATVWSLLLLVSGYPHVIPVAAYSTDNACSVGHEGLPPLTPPNDASAWGITLPFSPRSTPV